MQLCDGVMAMHADTEHLPMLDQLLGDSDPHDGGVHAGMDVERHYSDWACHQEASAGEGVHSGALMCSTFWAMLRHSDHAVADPPLPTTAV